MGPADSSRTHHALADNGASQRVADKIGLLPAGENVLHGHCQLVYRLD